MIASSTPFARTPQVRYFDGQKWYVLTEREGQKHLIIQDQRGQDMFSAPVEREDQRQQLAKDVLDKLRFMETTASRRSAAGAKPPSPQAAEPPQGTVKRP